MFRDRSEAGRELARMLAEYADKPDVIVLALPRGGVPVGYQVARALNAPLDVLIVRKLGVPGHEELAMGAVASGGIRVVNDDVVDALRIPMHVINAAAVRELAEMGRRERLYRGDRTTPDLRGKTVLLVDDGVATGSTMRAALAAVRQQQPARVVVAVPTAALHTCAEFHQEADACVCVETPPFFLAVGQGYEEFPQLTDAEVQAILRRTAEDCHPRRAPGAAAAA